jgi:hypothetical protein
MNCFLRLFLFSWGSIFLFFYSAYAGILLDVREVPYSNLISVISNLDLKAGLEGVVTRPPFKTYEQEILDFDQEVVYDFFDTGGRLQRGSFLTPMGDENTLKELSSYLREKKIMLCAWANLFFQKKGFLRSFWANTDFVPEDRANSDVYRVDIRNSAAVSKLAKIAASMRRLPIQKWIIDLRNIPPRERRGYIDFVRGQFGSQAVIVSDEILDGREVIFSAPYWQLRKDIFLNLGPHFTLLDKLGLRKEGFYFIESDSLSVDNYSALTFLLLEGCSVFMPYSMMKSYLETTFGRIYQDRSFQRKILSDERMFYYSRKTLIAFNFSETFGVWKTKNGIFRKGFYKSILGSSILNSSPENLFFFLFPQSIAVWDLEK